jgi:DNA gyrase subunit A
MIRQPVEKIKVIGRNTQGVKLLRLDDGAFISSITKVLKEDEDENGEENGEANTNETPSLKETDSTKTEDSAPEE